MEPLMIKLEPKSPEKFDDRVNSNNHFKFDVNEKLLDNLKSDYTSGRNIIKEEYDIPDDDNCVSTEDSNNSDLEIQENYGLNIERNDIQWPSKKNKKINTEQSHTSDDVFNVASNTDNLISKETTKLSDNNNKFVDAVTIDNKKNQSSRKASTPPIFRHYCSHCNVAKVGLRLHKKYNCIKCKKLMIIQCLKCNKRSGNAHNIKYHLETCNDDVKRFACEHCDFRASALVLLRNHIQRKHVERKKVKCSKCNKEFKNPADCKKHERICGKKGDLTCSFCSYATHRQTNLKLHLKRHEKHYQKTVEDVKNKTLVALDYLKDKHKERLYLYTSKNQAFCLRYCSKCNKTFDFKNNLVNSKVCEICKTKLSMRCIECNSLHKSLLALTHHLQSKCILRPKLQCSKCDYTTIYPASLQDHIQRKHVTIDPEKLYKCPICTSSFKLKNDLSKHVRHFCIASKPYLLCDYCPFKTKRKNCILRHIKSHMACESSKGKFRLGFCSKCISPRRVGKRSTVCYICKLPLLFSKSVSVETSTQRTRNLRGKKGPNSFECKNYGKAFVQLSNLDCHKKVCKSRISQRN